LARYFSLEAFRKLASPGKRGFHPQSSVTRGAVKMAQAKVDRRDPVQPLVRALEGRPVPYIEVVRSGRLIAAALVKRGRPVSMSGEGPSAGVWDLDRLSDEKAAAWGMWVATKVRRD